ncbi:unnamed protein product [Prunus armeniaca]|uniref:Uncharacterized protein n=1 Tax=Prunus armeniaca TaxID=36596 RepID=A0A6J5Y225_PRUAR|nr:unnamed protein product [Prunus armeniaca]
MEGLQKLIGKVSKDPPKLGNSSSSSSSSFDSHRAGEGLAAALSSSDQCRILFNRPASCELHGCLLTKLLAIVFRGVEASSITVDVLKALYTLLCCWNCCWLYTEATCPKLGFQTTQENQG